MLTHFSITPLWGGRKVGFLKGSERSRIRIYSQDKMNAIQRCFELGESIKSASEDIGYTRASIYSWRENYLYEGITALVNAKNIKPSTLIEGSQSIASVPSLA